MSDKREESVQLVEGVEREREILLCWQSENSQLLNTHKKDEEDIIFCSDWLAEFGFYETRKDRVGPSTHP